MFVTFSTLWERPLETVNGKEVLEIEQNGQKFFGSHALSMITTCTNSWKISKVKIYKIFGIFKKSHKFALFSETLQIGHN